MHFQKKVTLKTYSLFRTASFNSFINLSSPKNVHGILILQILDKPFGFTTLGGSMFTRGKLLEHWQEVLTLQKVIANQH